MADVTDDDDDNDDNYGGGFCSGDDDDDNDGGGGGGGGGGEANGGGGGGGGGDEEEEEEEEEEDFLMEKHRSSFSRCLRELGENGRREGGWGGGCDLFWFTLWRETIIVFRVDCEIVGLQLQPLYV